MVSRKALCFTGMAIWAGVIATAFAGPAASRPAAPNHISLVPIAAAYDAEGNPSCADMHTTFDGREAVYQSEERTISTSEAPTLRVSAERNGGVRVIGWSGKDYSVTLCKAVEGGSGADSLFSQIHLRFQSGELGVTGPSGSHHWSTTLIVKAPQGASLDVRSENGPLSLDRVNGKVKVHTMNGPVTVERCTGELDLDAQNGPVTLDENGGKQNVRMQNGPLTVSLALPSWNGEGLQAHAENGPITLRVPAGYGSGVTLETDGNGPFSCGGAMCSGGRKTWEDEHRRVEYGPSPSVVRISAQNGPVTVR